MKKKTNINRPDISSEEILKGKNFNSVLQQHKITSKPSYKKPWFLSGAGVIAVAAAVVVALNTGNNLQNKSKEPVAENSITDSVKLAEFYNAEANKPFVNPPLKDLNIPITKFKVIAEKGGKLKFDKTGSKIEIPKNSFVDESGKVVKGEVELHYREFHDAVDFFLSGIPMTYDSAGVRYQFESAGMMEILAYQDGKPLTVATGKTIVVDMPSSYKGNEYNLYKLDETSNNWSCLGKGKVTTGSKEEETFSDASKPQEIAKLNEYKVIEEKKMALEKQKEDKITTLVKVLPEPLKPQQLRKDKYTFNIDVDPKEFPELVTYKGVLFEVGNENKSFTKAMFDIVWDEATIKDGPEKGKNYVITVKKALKSYDLIVYPVFEGKDYVTALKIYEEKFQKYSASLEKRKEDERKIEEEYHQHIAQLKHQQEELEKKWKEREDNLFKQMSTLEKVHRVFAVNGFGIYNSDKPSEYPTGMTCTASLNKAAHKKLMCYDVYLVDKQKNALFSFTKNPVVKFSFNPASENILWTVENGKLYCLKPTKFSCFREAGDIKEVEMEKVEQVFKNADEMKAFFNL